MVKFLKQNKAVVVLQGRFAGRKAVIVRSFDDGTRDRPYGHCLVAGIAKYPKKVIRKDSAKKTAKKSRVKAFIKLVNYNHLMPTRYTLDVDLKDVVTVDALQSRDKKVTAAKETKARFEERFKTGKNSTDKMSEAAILEVVRKNFGDHLILGEEGGLIGDTSSDYLWCIDPLDGTTNFAHCYPSFAVSVGVLFRGKPAAAAVVEFVGGPMCWNTRIFSATTGGGAFCNGQKIHASQTDLVEQSLLVTGFGYEHDDAWATNIDLFKEFTDVSRGVRRLGAAAVDMCHVALGIVEAYWEYRLKPWDMAAGVLIVEEAGGTVTCMDGGKFCVFDRSVLVSNGVLHSKLLERIGPATEKLKKKGIDFSLWYKPENYNTDF